MSLPVSEAAAFCGRLLIAALFLHEAWSKVTGYSAAIAYAQAFGVPGALIPIAIAVETGCGLLILLGYHARAAALLLAGFCVATAVLFHAKLGNRNELLHFEKDLAIAGGLLVLFARGAGAWALDARRSRLGYIIPALRNDAALPGS
jgi:putative oxidoreductase